MKINQLINKYAETVILPPALKGIEERIPGPSKVPTIIERNFDDPIYDELAELSKKKMEEKRPELQKRMKEQEIENLKRLLMEHEEERSEERPTDFTPPDPELLRPTSITVSERLYNLFQKYAAPPHTKSPIRPPPPEDEEFDLSIPSLGETPIIPELSEEEMKNWEDFIALKKRKEERLEGYLGEESKLDPDEGTVPPPKKKSNLKIESLLKRCSQYYDLCRKL